MSLIPDALAYLKAHPMIQQWEELCAVLERMGTTAPKSWDIPAVTCRAVGGAREAALPAVAALGCAQLGIILIDDMLDNDPEGEYQRIGAGRAANLAAALSAAATDLLLAGSDLPAAHNLQAVRMLNAMCFQTAHGQALDIQNPGDEAAYWAVVRSKSSPYYGTAFALGALCGGAEAHCVAQIEQLGRLYGELIQVHDDLKDSLAQPANADWLEKRNSLPILFASLVAHPEREEFLRLRADIEAPGNLARAQDILVSCGAVSFCMDALLERYLAARKLLAEIELHQREQLEKLIEEMVIPLRELIKEVGAQQPAALRE